jgi:hypothetical protein
VVDIVQVFVPPWDKQSTESQSLVVNLAAESWHPPPQHCNGSGPIFCWYYHNTFGENLTSDFGIQMEALGNDPIKLGDVMNIQDGGLCCGYQ